MGHNPYYINALARSCIFSLLSANNSFIIFWLVYIVFGMHVSVYLYVYACACASGGMRLVLGLFFSGSLLTKAVCLAEYRASYSASLASLWNPGSA